MYIPFFIYIYMCTYSNMHTHSFVYIYAFIYTFTLIHMYWVICLQPNSWKSAYNQVYEESSQEDLKKVTLLFETCFALINELCSISMNDSCHTDEWVMSHTETVIWKRGCWNIRLCSWVMSHLWMSCFPHIMSHLWMSCFPHMNGSCLLWMSHVLHEWWGSSNMSCHLFTCEWGVLHI